MNPKQSYIVQLAAVLLYNGMRMSVPDLALDLNSKGFRTSYGAPYQGARGTYTLLGWTYHQALAHLSDAQADAVLLAFVTPSGDYAWR